MAIYTFTHEENNGTKLTMTYDDAKDPTLGTLVDNAIIPFLLGVTFQPASLKKIFDSEVL